MHQDINPFTVELTAKTDALKKLVAERDLWESQLSWYTVFDPEVAHQRQLEATRQSLRSKADSENVRAKLVSEMGMLDIRRSNAGIGLNPLYWFSSERAAAKQQLELGQQTVDRMKSHYDFLDKQAQTNAELAQSLTDDLQRYRAIDSQKAKSAIHDLDAEIAQARPELALLNARHAEADKKLRPLYAQLDEYQRQHTEVMREIDQAKRFDQALTDATSSNEKRMIHQQCGQELGESSPQKAMQSRQGRLKWIERETTKLQKYLAVTLKRLTGDIRSLVIDGNNLCYKERSTFVGLAALEAIVPLIIQAYKVTIVFDPHADRLLKMDLDEIKAHFDPTVSVHIMNSHNAADETILSVAAANPGTYILSNDNYTEFMDNFDDERRVMRDILRKRVLKHEIVGNLVHIPDLDLSIEFA